jgi:ankyrin
VHAVARDAVTPLHVSSRRGHVAATVALLDAGASVTARTIHQQTALHLAADAGHADCVTCLIGRGSPVDATAAQRRTPLHVACRRGRVAATRALLPHCPRAVLDAVSDGGLTALDLAARDGHIGCVSALLAAGASVTLAGVGARTLPADISAVL